MADRRGGPIFRALARTRRAAGSKGELFAAGWAIAAQQAYLLDEATKAYEAGLITVEDTLKATNVAAPTLAKMLGELGALPAKRGPGRPPAEKPEPETKPAAAQENVSPLAAARARRAGA